MIELRQVGQDDWRTWREIRLLALEEAPNAFSSSLAYWRGPGDTEERWRQRLRDVALNVVAVADGRGVGQVSCTTADDGGIPELISMWVAPEVRGTGLGDALVKEVILWAQEHGSHEVKLAVMERNTQAIDLYHRHGFVFTNETASEGQVVMALSIP